MIQYADWQAGSDLPKSSASFITLMNRAERSYRADEDQRMAVVCM